MISLRQTARKLGGSWILRDLNLDLAPGQLVALVGPSGCGKSTLLRLLAGLDQPDEGEVLGRPVSIGLVFQEANLLEWRNALENCQLPLEIRGALSPAEMKRRCQDVLELCGLRDAMNLRPSQMSGGMKMRCALARALVTEPGLLLLDEPFAALDEIVRGRLGEELVGIVRRRQAPSLLVTHSLSEACFLADRVILMAPSPGRIIHDQSLDFGPRSPELKSSLPFLSVLAELQQRLRQALPLEPRPA